MDQSLRDVIDCLFSDFSFVSAGDAWHNGPPLANFQPLFLLAVCT